MFPLAIGVPGIALALIGLARGIYVVRFAGQGRPGTGRSLQGFSEAGLFFAWLLGILVATVVVGQLVALPLFMALYLRMWGGYGWTFALAYGAGGWLFLYLMFETVVHVVWYPALFSF